MRLFIAVNFDPRVRGAIAAAIGAFPIESPPWRWTKPDTWHVTLKFLGERSETDAHAIAACVEGVAKRHRAFDLELREFGGFPHLNRPRVLFYRADRGADELRALAADIDRTLADALGIPEETKKFRAHATIARVKTRIPRPVADLLPSVPPLSGAVQTVQSFELMKSTLHRDGARYERFKAFALPPAP
jgi:2'-5' RNA ligase